MVKLPDSARRYFWEVKFDEIDPSKNARYVIERLLEYGDFPELRWLFQNFSKPKIANVLIKSRSLSLRSAYYWSQILNVPKRDVLCLSKHFRATQNQIWKR